MRLNFTICVLLLLSIAVHADAQFKLIQSSPKMYAADASVNQTVVLTFNEDLSAGTTASNLLLTSDLKGRTDFTITVTGAALTVTPSHAFRPGEKIMLTMLSTLRSASNASLSGGTFLTFSVKTGSPLSQPPLFLVKQLPGLSGFITSTDIDSDGDNDIILTTPTETYGSDLVLMENGGQGDFTKRILLTSIASVRKIVPFDLDQDGDMDLVMATGAGLISYNNDGSENFNAQQIDPYDPMDLDIIDFDLDGLYDIVFSTPAGGIYVDFNRGTSFNTVKLSSATARQLRVTDADNDGDLDILIRDEVAITCLLNTAGSMQPHVIQHYDDGFTNIFDMAVDDFNNDSNIDIAITTNFAISILSNVGAAQFTATNLTALDNKAIRIASADYNGDGLRDLIYSVSGEHYMLVNSIAGFTSVDIMPEQNTLLQAGYATTADFNGDGALDFAVPGYYHVGVFYSTTSAKAIPFTEIKPSGLTELRYADADWGDYDNDGDLDLLMIGSNDAEGGIVTQLYENKSGSLVKTDTDMLGYFQGSCDWGDFDRDGDLDILLAGESPGGPSIAIYINNAGKFTLMPIPANVPTVYNGEVRWADMNNDGRLDIVMVGQYKGGIFELVPDAGFVKRAELPADMENLDVADFDGDGDMDVVTSAGKNILTNDGEWKFRITESFIDGSHVNWVDIDNDGDMDLTEDASDLVIYQTENSRVAKFSEVRDFPSPDNTSTTGDLDNDGFADLVAATNDGYNGPVSLTLLINAHNGSMIRSDFRLSGISASVIKVADYDGDHDLDIMTAGHIIRNNMQRANTRPTAPQFLKVDSVYNNSIYVHWNEASDLESGSGGLSYQLYAGTQSHQQNIIFSNADMVTGLRRISESGNIKGNHSRIKLTESGTYYIGVQSIDASFEGSTFSNEVATTVVLVQGEVVACVGSESKFTASPSGNYHWEVIGGSVIAGQGTGSITVKWSAAGFGKVKMLEGAVLRNTLGIVVDAAKPKPLIEGQTEVCLSNQDYTLYDQTSYATQWSIIGADNGEVDGSEHAAYVNWQVPGQQQLVAKSFSKNLGCTNSDTLLVTVFPPPVSKISLLTNNITSATLTASPSANNEYIWYFDFIPIVDGPFQQISTRYSGYYTVEVFSEYMCSATSEPFDLTLGETQVTGVNSAENFFKVYPVPTEKNIFIQISNGTRADVAMSVYSTTGTKVMQEVFSKVDDEFKKEVDVSVLIPGVYIMTLQNGNDFYQTKIIRN